MARRTIHLPDELDKRVRESGAVEDSFSAVVQDALREYIDGPEDERQKAEA